jgi:hypothetical protein
MGASGWVVFRLFSDLASALVVDVLRESLLERNGNTSPPSPVV